MERLHRNLAANGDEGETEYSVERSGIIDLFHNRLDHDLRNLVRAAEAGTWEEVTRIVENLKRDLEAHFDFEEGQIFPLIERHSRGGEQIVSELISDHRSSLASLRHIARMIAKMVDHQAPTEPIVFFCQSMHRMLKIHTEAEEHILNAFFKLRFSSDERQGLLSRAALSALSA